MKLLIVDTETGGMDPEKHSILSLAGVVWEDGDFDASIELRIREDPIIVTPKAMEVNRINLASYTKNTFDPQQAILEFGVFVAGAFRMDEVVLAGHNVAFDIGFMKRLYRLGGESYARKYSHRSLDTASVLRYLVLCGRLPESVISSDGAFAYFDIPFGEGKRHTALGDAIATAQLLTKLVAMLKG